MSRPTPTNELCGCCTKKEYYNKVVQIECGLCNLWFHLKCVGMPDPQFQLLKSSQNNIHWFCNSCEILSKPLLTRLTKIEQNVEYLNERVKTLEEKPAVKPDSASLISSASNEVAERLKKTNNAVIYGLPEESAGDTAEVSIVLKSINMDSTKPLELIRLGKGVRKNQHGNTIPRPLLIKLNSEQEKWKVIKEANKPENRTKPELKNISIKPDLTKTQRDEEFQLRSELRQRKAEGEQDLVIRGGKIIEATKNGKPVRDKPPQQQITN